MTATRVVLFDVRGTLVDGPEIDFGRRIATALGLSVRTVEGHRRTVLRKMDVDSATKLARAIAGIRRP